MDLRPSNFQAKWSKNLFQTLQKSIKKSIEKIFGFLIDFFAILSGFWGQLGAKLGSKIHQNRFQIDQKAHSKNEQKKVPKKRVQGG